MSQVFQLEGIVQLSKVTAEAFKKKLKIQQ